MARLGRRTALRRAVLAAFSAAILCGLLGAAGLPASASGAASVGASVADSRAADASASPSAPGSETAGEAEPGPGDVSIPYGEPATIEPAPPWRIGDCGVPRAASALVVACDETQVELAAPSYDPKAGVAIIPVQLVHGAVTTTVPYRVTLAPPAAPVAKPSTAVRPVPAGSLLRVPISDLGVTCPVCAGGGTLDALGVEPAAAGELWATPTHLVFRAAAGYRGPVELSFRFADDFGTASPDARVLASVYVPVRASAAGQPLAALDVVVPAEAGRPVAIDLHDLVFGAGDDGFVVVACGAAMHGTVSCTADGAATYTGTGEADQFGFHIAAPNGEHAFGSVTFAPEASDTLAPGPAPAAPGPSKHGVRAAVTPPAPLEDHAGPAGALSPLVAILDRIGAR